MITKIDDFILQCASISSTKKDAISKLAEYNFSFYLEDKNGYPRICVRAKNELQHKQLDSYFNDEMKKNDDLVIMQENLDKKEPYFAIPLTHKNVEFFRDFFNKHDSEKQVETSFFKIKNIMENYELNSFLLSSKDPNMKDLVYSNDEIKKESLQVLYKYKPTYFLCRHQGAYDLYYFYDRQEPIFLPLLEGKDPLMLGSVFYTNEYDEEVEEYDVNTASEEQLQSINELTGHRPIFQDHFTRQWYFNLFETLVLKRNQHNVNISQDIVNYQEKNLADSKALFFIKNDGSMVTNDLIKNKDILQNIEKISDEFNVKNNHNTEKMKLRTLQRSIDSVMHRTTYQNAFNFGRFLGWDNHLYPNNSEGLCLGLSMRWIEASLLKETEQFYKRVNRMLNYTVFHHLEGKPITKATPEEIDAFNQLMNKVYNNLNPIQIEKDDIQSVETRAFYESLNIYQNSEELYKDIFGRPISQLDLIPVSNLAASQKIEQKKGLECLGVEYGTYILKEIEHYFSEIEDAIKKSGYQPGDVVTFCLTDKAHAIAVSYNVGNSPPWRFLNANDVCANEAKTACCQLSDLANKINKAYNYDHKSGDNAQYRTFATCVLSTGDDQHAATLKNELTQLKQKHYDSIKIDNAEHFRELISMGEQDDTLIDILIKKCSSLNKKEENLNTQGDKLPFPHYLSILICQLVSMDKYDKIIKNKLIEKYSLLSKEGKNFNVQDDELPFPHYLSILKNNNNTNNMMSELVKQGVNLDMEDKHGVTPLALAIVFNNDLIVNTLIDQSHVNLDRDISINSVKQAIEIIEKKYDQAFKGIKEKLDQYMTDIKNDRVKPLDLALLLGNDSTANMIKKSQNTKKMNTPKETMDKFKNTLNTTNDVTIEDETDTIYKAPS